jgi:hypothetical protein
MVECDVLKENWPLLLTESLDVATRERAHQHIEQCAHCSADWAAFRGTWDMLADLPVVPVPARVKEKFLAQVMPQQQQLPAAATAANNVVTFQRRPAMKWLAQAAAVVVIAGGSYLAGHRSTPVVVQSTPAADAGNAANFQHINATPYSIAESRVLNASAVNPNIEGRPDIENVQFADTNPNDDDINLSFDITSHVTVTGKPNDKSMVRLLSYVLQNEDKLTPSRSRTIDWVRRVYSDPRNADPEIAAALANVLRNDEHQGVRISAVETLKTMQPKGATDTTTQALIEALKGDPNPAVRLKAVEALANMAKSGTQLDTNTLDTLRQKASQDDENTYVRVKAAEALSNVRP